MQTVELPSERKHSLTNERDELKDYLNTQAHCNPASVTGAIMDRLRVINTELKHL